MEQRKYLIIVEGGNGVNYAAYSPDVPGCITTGDTLGETIDNMRDALEFHFEGMLEDGDEIPEGSDGTAVYISVTIPEMKHEVA
jgi:predicted RNase H-like HicB family nuclease